MIIGTCTNKECACNVDLSFMLYCSDICERGEHDADGNCACGHAQCVGAA